jgi:tetratricopeptide (TPR) repeat protein
MKAKRRHELVQNDLSKAIVRLPTFFELYGNKILIAIIFLCLGVFVFRWQWSRRTERAEISGDSLAEARQSLTELANVTEMAGGIEQTAAVRSQLITDIRESLERVKLNTTDRAQLAEALVARGDLNWQLANMPELPGATTRPMLRLDQTSTESLDNAEKAYSEILDQYPDQKLAMISARFGLAAVDENNHAWNKAGQEYQAIQTDASASPGFKEQAKTREKLLAEISQPTFLATPATQPVAGK